MNRDEDSKGATVTGEKKRVEKKEKGGSGGA